MPPLAPTPPPVTLREAIAVARAIDRPVTRHLHVTVDGFLWLWRLDAPRAG
jgi:hypothetical protein